MPSPLAGKEQLSLAVEEQQEGLEIGEDPGALTPSPAWLLGPMVNPTGHSPARCTHLPSSLRWPEGLILSTALAVGVALAQTMSWTPAASISGHSHSRQPPKELGTSVSPASPSCHIHPSVSRSLCRLCRDKYCSKKQPPRKWVKENERDVGEVI